MLLYLVTEVMVTLALFNHHGGFSMRAIFHYLPPLTDIVELLKSSGQRRYTVAAKIVFEFATVKTIVDQGVLRDAILATDSMTPWTDDSKPSESTIYIGPATFAGNHDRDGSLWFPISPGLGSVRKGQVSGYESYLVKMVAELRRKQLTGVSNVRAVIEVFGLVY